MQEKIVSRLIVNRLQRFRLFGVERQGLGRHDLLIGIGVTLRNLRGDLNQALVLKLADGRSGGACDLQQLLQWQRAVFLNHLIHLQLALGQFTHAIIARQQPHMQAFAPAFLLLAHGIGQHTLKSGFRCTAIILGNPSRQFQHPRRHQRLRANDFGDGFERIMIRLLGQTGHAPEHLPSAEGHLYPRADLHPTLHFGRDEVIKLPAQGDLQCHTRNHAPPSRLYAHR